LRDRRRRQGRDEEGGIANPCVAALTGDHIGYILTPDEYKQGGYEATASFYGETLGVLLRKTPSTSHRQSPRRRTDLLRISAV